MKHSKRPCVVTRWKEKYLYSNRFYGVTDKLSPLC